MTDLRLYVAAAGTAVIAVETLAQAAPVNPWAAAGLALVTATVPVLISHFLTRRKLRAQAAKVEEVHVLVNSRLSRTLDALTAAMLENIALKEAQGIPVSEQERAIAADPALIAETDSDVEAGADVEAERRGLEERPHGS